MMAYVPPIATEANLIFSGAYSPVSANAANLYIGYTEETRIQSVLYQIWTDENYIYCATADGLGIIPIGG